jgi:hypothetical protein
MDSGGGGGEVGEVPRVLADDGLDAVETRRYVHVFDPVFVAPRASGYDQVQAGIGVAPTGWPITSTRPAPAERRAPRRSSSAGRHQYDAYDIDTLTAALKTAKAQPKPRRAAGDYGRVKWPRS